MQSWDSAADMPARSVTLNMVKRVNITAAASLLQQ